MTRKIKILHCLETIGSGGVEQRRRLIFKHLNTELFEHKVICTKAIGALPEQIKTLGVEIIEVGEFSSFFEFNKYREVIRVIKSFKPDIIHGAVFEGVSMACVAGKCTGSFPIIAEETSEPSNRNWKGNLLAKLLYILADKVVAVSPGVQHYLSETLNLSLSKTITINNGVRDHEATNTQKLKKLRLEYNIKENEIVIIKCIFFKMS